MLHLLPPLLPHQALVLSPLDTSKGHPRPVLGAQHSTHRTHMLAYANKAVHQRHCWRTHWPLQGAAAGTPEAVPTVAPLVGLSCCVVLVASPGVLGPLGRCRAALAEAAVRQTPLHILVLGGGAAVAGWEQLVEGPGSGKGAAAGIAGAGAQAGEAKEETPLSELVGPTRMGWRWWAGGDGPGRVTHTNRFTQTGHIHMGRTTQLRQAAAKQRQVHNQL